MKILLHICCAPCAVYCVNRLRDENNDIQGLFYNTNIHPRIEYRQRRESTQLLSEKLNFKTTYLRDYMYEDFFRRISFHESPEERCPLCWSLRLHKTAEFASKNGFDGFTTTLLISPYQDHSKIKAIGKEAEIKHSVQFVYKDFRDGFRQSHRLSRDMGFYHQKYCGCVYSELERYKERKN